MLRVIVLLFFAIALASPSVSFKLDANGAEYMTVVFQSGVMLGDSADCDDDYRNAHGAPIHVSFELAALFTPLIRGSEYGRAQQFCQIKAPLFNRHTVLRI